jgi:hypothetical protein
VIKPNATKSQSQREYFMRFDKDRGREAIRSVLCPKGQAATLLGLACMAGLSYPRLSPVLRTPASRGFFLCRLRSALPTHRTPGRLPLVKTHMPTACRKSNSNSPSIRLDAFCMQAFRPLPRKVEG